MKFSEAEDGLPGLRDPESALRRQLQRLVVRFSGVTDAGTVERLVLRAYTDLRRTATVHQHLPMLALHIADEQLTAIAAAARPLTRPAPTVVFTGGGRIERVHMAAALTDHWSDGRVDVRTSGHRTAQPLDPVVVEALVEIGAGIAGWSPRPLPETEIATADIVVTMDGGPGRPASGGDGLRTWSVRDPAEQPIRVVRAIRDDIESRVRLLLRELEV